PEMRAKIAGLQKQIDEKTRQIQNSDANYKALVAKANAIDGKRAALQFAYNTLKAETTVKETLLQDAITAGDKKTREKLTSELEAPRKQVAKQAEDLASLNKEMDETQAAMEKQLAEVTALKKQLKQLNAEIEGQRKKRALLQPEGFVAK